ncbi:heme-binding protein [bacterium]|nr:heme-binding protein [bacterium]
MSFTRIKFAVLIAGALATSGCAIAAGALGIRSIYEEPEYKTLAPQEAPFEVREYGERLAIEATVPVTSDRGDDNSAFRVLFRYISGENRVQQKIDMTVPVEVEEPRSEKIAMTVPVEVNESGEESTMTMKFFLPAEYTMETAPAPVDSRLQLITLPPQTVAVLRFSGAPSQEDIDRRQEELQAALAASTDWEPVGEPTIYYYDAPFTPPLLRRNEIIVPVEQSQEED